MVPQESFDAPAFSPEATVDDLKQEAIRTVEELLEAYPDSTDSLPVAARLQSSLGNSDVAVKMWQRCAQIDPRYVDAYFAMGVAARKRGDLQEAEKMFEKVMSRAPSHPEAPALLADALMQSGRAEEAVAVLEGRVRGPAVLDKTMLTLGRAYLQLNEWEKAKQTFETLIQADPTESSAYYGLARAYARLGQRNKSQQYLQKYRSLASVDHEQYARDIRLYADAATVRRILAKTLLESGQVYRKHGETAKAEQRWRKAAVLEAENTQCRYELLYLYEEQQRDREALRISKELCEIEPENPDHWLYFGVLSGRLQQFDAALAALEHAVKLDPKNPRYRQAYALVKEGM